MTVYRRDGDSWAEVDTVGLPDDDALVKVKRAEGWEVVWPREIEHVASSDGNWGDPATWESGTVPTAGTSAVVRSDTTVTVSQVGTARVKHLQVDGTLRHDASADSRLRVETIAVSPDGRYEMGTSDAPVRPGTTAEIEFLDMGTHESSNVPDRLGKGLLVRGEIEIHGAEKTPWDSLSSHPRAGDGSVVLDSAPTNWRAGDTIVIPDLESYSSADLDHDDEERTVSAVEGSTVYFDTPLSSDHVPPSGDLPSFVVNLTRNARMYSESDDTDGYGHFMMMSPAQTVQYLELADMGRTEKARDPTSPNWERGTPDPSSPPNPRARYPLHFHKTGPAESPHVVRGCSVRGSPGWGVVNHGSNAEVEDCVSYECYGAGFVAENGTEVGHFRRNFALRSEGSGEDTESRKAWSNAFANQFVDPPHNVDDFGHSGHGFWIHSPLVEVEGNVAGGHRHTPITFWTRALHEEPLARDGGGNFTEFLDGKHDMFPKIQADLLTDLERRWAKFGGESSAVGEKWHNKDSSWVYGTSLPVRSFKDNVAFGCGGGFDLRGGLGFRNQQSKLDRCYHSGNTSFNTGELWLADGSAHGREDFTSSGNVGLDHRYVGNLVAEGYRLEGDGTGIAVYHNNSYIDDYHVHNCNINNWSRGVVPSFYTWRSATEIRDTDFKNNDRDIYLKGKFGSGGRVIARGNSYSGNTDLYWDELHPSALIPTRLLGSNHTTVTFEGRTVYHGWSDPDFVLVRSEDTERLGKLMNHGNKSRWEEWLDGDDPTRVLPGTTHRELYDQYGITFYGGMQDPDQPGFERPASFGGSDGVYDSTPFLGPAEASQPSDEIWIDAVNEMSFRGNYSIVAVGDSVPNAEPLQLANGQRAVQLDRAQYDGWELPVADGDGVASYSFEVSEAGEYHVHFRCQQGKSDRGGNERESRFFTRVDGGRWKLQNGGNGLAPSDDLVWPDVDSNGPSTYTAHDLAAGKHTIEIAGKGHGMRLDWVLIKHETNGANPHGSGKPHSS